MGKVKELFFEHRLYENAKNEKYQYALDVFSYENESVKRIKTNKKRYDKSKKGYAQKFQGN